MVKITSSEIQLFG